MKKWLFLGLLLFISIASILMLTRSSSLNTLMAEISNKDPKTSAMLESMRHSKYRAHSLADLMLLSDVDALYEVAVRTFNGIGLSTDGFKAVKELESLAERGHVQSMEYLGYIYDSGKNPTYFSHEKAVKWYREAANNGSVSGAYYICAHHISKSEYSTAFIWCKIAADAGIPAAESTLGYMYASGTGTEKDLERAAKYICSAKSKGRVSRQALERYGITCPLNPENSEN